MPVRGVTEAQVVRALRTYHTVYPAEPLPHTPLRSVVYVATVDGRELKVYVRLGSEPPFVTTVAWRDT
jgi:hypothetical protein